MSFELEPENPEEAEAFGEVIPIGRGYEFEEDMFEDVSILRVPAHLARIIDKDVIKAPVWEGFDRVSATMCPQHPKDKWKGVPNLEFFPESMLLNGREYKHQIEQLPYHVEVMNENVKITDVSHIVTVSGEGTPAEWSAFAQKHGLGSLDETSSEDEDGEGVTVGGKGSEGGEVAGEKNPSKARSSRKSRGTPGNDNKGARPSTSPRKSSGSAQKQQREEQIPSFFSSASSSEEDNNDTPENDNSVEDSNIETTNSQQKPFIPFQEPPDDAPDDEETYCGVVPSKNGITNVKRIEKDVPQFTEGQIEEAWLALVKIMEGEGYTFLEEEQSVTEEAMHTVKHKYRTSVWHPGEGVGPPSIKASPASSEAGVSKVSKGSNKQSRGGGAGPASSTGAKMRAMRGITGTQ